MLLSLLGDSPHKRYRTPRGSVLKETQNLGFYYWALPQMYPPPQG